MLSEMMEMVIDGDWSVHADHIVGILEHGVDYLKKILPECAPSRDVIRATLGNTKHSTLVYNGREAFLSLLSLPNQTRR